MMPRDCPRQGSKPLLLGPLGLCRWLALIACLLATLESSATADIPPPAAQEIAGAADESAQIRSHRFLDRIWGHATLYENPESQWLQEVTFVGRIQADFPVFDSNQGNFDDPQMRRFRSGLKTRWREDFVLHAEVDIDFDCDRREDCGDSEYEGMTELYLGWDRHRAFSLKIGKLSAPFTLDGTTSSKRLITLERNNVTQNLWFTVEYHAGASIAGSIENWSYRVGAFSSSTKEEFGTFDGGFFLLFSASHDFAKRLDLPEAVLSVDYVYNDEHENNVATRALSHVLSLHGRFDTGGWGIRADLSGGIGYGSQRDLMGLAITPFYHLSSMFQVVGRYTYLESRGRDGIRFSRYDDRIDSGRGGQYDEFFIGLNCFLYGHKLKIQSGVKYVLMSDRESGTGNYRGWGWTTGVRIGW
jgi:phosphate-selective porin OprO/OprP